MNSLIRKIKPTTLEFANKRGAGGYDAAKKPQKSILRMGVDRQKPKSGKKNKRVRVDAKAKVHYVANWKFLNVDMSKEGKMYNHFNRRHQRDDPCRVF